ncbi:MAG TPA: hypothetical protein VHE12_05925 [bacterium]|nr:hypothetical protein [bacterium]
MTDFKGPLGIRPTKETKTIGKRKKDRPATDLRRFKKPLKHSSPNTRKGALERFFQRYSKPLLALVYEKALGVPAAVWLRSGNYEPDHILRRDGVTNGIPNMVSLRNLQFLTHEVHALKTAGRIVVEPIVRPLVVMVGVEEVMTRIEAACPAPFTLQELADAYKAERKRLEIELAAKTAK